MIRRSEQQTCGQFPAGFLENNDISFPFFWYSAKTGPQSFQQIYRIWTPEYAGMNFYEFINFEILARLFFMHLGEKTSFEKWVSKFLTCLQGHDMSASK